MLPRLSVLSLFLAVLVGCDTSAPDTDFEDDVARAGGETTVFRASPESFSTPALNLIPARLDLHLAGDVTFESVFVTAPAPVNPGLGPVFNRASCTTCHVKDGRSEPDISLLLRVSLGQEADGRHIPVPGYGLQIQDRAVFGVTPEARVVVEYEEVPGSFADGESYSLRRPTYRIEDPYRPLPAGVLTSPRMARPIFGMGLLEAVTEATLLDLAAAQSAAGEVSGRPNYVWNPEAERFTLGRLGWKANEPTVRQQSADAYRDDMGITSPVFPDAAPFGYDSDNDASAPEIDERTLEATTFYVQTLGVPAARGVGEREVERGRDLFAEVGCASCHVPRLRTGTLDGLPEVSNQTIYPYTDLLLHDMGEGLADGRPDFAATGSEWRTPPLWGIGLTQLVNQHTFFLHDGRARNLTEAILWHGGEAEASKETFRRLSKAERDALLVFLESL